MENKNEIVVSDRTEIIVSDNTFNKEVIEKSSEIPILVDFWASWCGPCRTLGPVLKNLAEKYHGKFILAKLSVEENQQKSQEFAIMSIPAVKLFKDGKVVDGFVGSISEKQIISFLNKNGIKG